MNEAAEGETEAEVVVVGGILIDETILITEALHLSGTHIFRRAMGVVGRRHLTENAQGRDRDRGQEHHPDEDQDHVQDLVHRRSA